MFQNLNIVIGVTGGIAAYKACGIVSYLKKEGAHVDVIMTKHATEFITPLTLETLAQSKVVTDMFERSDYIEVEHILLARKADLFLIVPATANLIGKVASGIADDMLSTTIMATKAPVIFAPAMNNQMYENPIVQENMQKLKQYGYHFIEPDVGKLACGYDAKGKLPSTECIIEMVQKLMRKKTIIVTSRGTSERIDNVRKITNTSSDKLGKIIAEELLKTNGENIATLYYLCSKTAMKPTHENVKIVEIEGTYDLKDKVEYLLNSTKIDCFIHAMAVSDYTTEYVTTAKNWQIILKAKRIEILKKRLKKIQTF